MSDAYLEDPFALSSDEGPNSLETTSAANREESFEGSRVLLAISLCLVVFVGSLMPWVMIRPLTDTRSSYNLTDVPGGIGILASVSLFVVIGAILLGFKHRVGLTMMSISAGVLGWMATISGLLLGVVGSLLPSINVAGIDLTKAQVGQGPGVPVTLVASLLLGILCVRKFEPISSMSPSFGIRILPIAAIVPLIAIAINHHAGWLVLGTEQAGWTAEVPGDSFYGSGIVLLLIYFCTGLWFVTFVVRTRALTIFTSALSVVIGVICGIFAVLVWLGGKALKWLIPSSVEGWTTVSTQAPLYFSLVGSVVLLAISIAGFFPSVSERSFNIGKRVSVGSSRFASADVAGGGILFLTSVVILLVKLF